MNKNIFFLVLAIILSCVTQDPATNATQRDTTVESFDEAASAPEAAASHGPIKAYGTRQVLTFTGSTGWTVPPGIGRVLACGCGGGGGGGSGGGGSVAGGTYGLGGGGGGGALWHCFSVAVVPNTALTVLPGTGGAGATGNSTTAGNQGAIGKDSFIYITSSNFIIASFAGASGGDLGQISNNPTRCWGGAPTAAGTASVSPAAARNIYEFDMGPVLNAGSPSITLPSFAPQAGGRGATASGFAGNTGGSAIIMISTGTQGSTWAGGAGGTGNAPAGGGGGGGASAWGPGGAGGASAATTSSNGGAASNAPAASKCAGGGGGGGGGSAAATTGGAGGNGGDGTVSIEF